MKYRTEYLKSGGIFCPFCHCEDIEGASVDIVGSIASQEVSCLRCGASWQNEYRLTDVVTIDEPD